MQMSVLSLCLAVNDRVQTVCHDKQFIKVRLNPLTVTFFPPSLDFIASMVNTWYVPYPVFWVACWLISSIQKHAYSPGDSNVSKTKVAKPDAMQSSPTGILRSFISLLILYSCINMYPMLESACQSSLLSSASESTHASDNPRSALLFIRSKSWLILM